MPSFSLLKSPSCKQIDHTYSELLMVTKLINDAKMVQKGDISKQGVPCKPKLILDRGKSIQSTEKKKIINNKALALKENISSQSSIQKENIKQKEQYFYQFGIDQKNLSHISKSPDSKYSQEESFAQQDLDIPNETTDSITLYTSVGDFRDNSDSRRCDTRTSSVETSRVLRVCYPNNNGFTGKANIYISIIGSRFWFQKLCSKSIQSLRILF
jgi:hypothetical protein